jgi:hypothetical protein
VDSSYDNILWEDFVGKILKKDFINKYVSEQPKGFINIMIYTLATEYWLSSWSTEMNQGIKVIQVNSVNGMLCDVFNSLFSQSLLLCLKDQLLPVIQVAILLLILRWSGLRSRLSPLLERWGEECIEILPENTYIIESNPYFPFLLSNNVHRKGCSVGIAQNSIWCCCHELWPQSEGGLISLWNP